MEAIGRRRPDRHAAVRVALLALVLVLLAAACGGAEEPSVDGAAGDPAAGQTTEPAADSAGTEPPAAQPEELTPVEVVVPAPTIIPFYPLYVADHQGFFAEEGLDVTINSVEGTDPVIQALAAGQVDIAEIITNSIMIAGTAREEFDPVMFHLDYGKSPFDVVVPADSDVQEAADLAGATIGVGTPEGAESVTARALMGSAGLEEGVDYDLLVVGDAGQAIAAFDRGDIDAYAGGIGDLSVLRARGLELRSLSPEEFRSRTGIGFAALQSFVEENPDLVEAFSRAATRGYEYIGDDVEQLLDITGEIRAADVEERDVATALAETAIELRELEDGMRPGEHDPELWQSWWDNLVRQGAIDPEATDKTVEDFYTNDYVAE